MKKGQEFVLTIEEVDFPNKGIAYAEEKKIIVKNTLPGQKVLARIAKKKGKKIVGRVLETLEEAPGQIDPQCVHFPACGGCVYQHYPYDMQLALKGRQIQKILEAAGVDPSLYEGVKPSPKQKAYRNKMEFTFGDQEKDGPLTIGMHERGRFYEIVPTTDCQIVDEDYRKILTATQAFFRENKTPYYHRRAHKGILRHLVIRRAEFTGEILVNLVTSTQGPIDAEGYVALLQGLELNQKLVGIIHTENDSLGDVVQADRVNILYGRDYLVENLLGLTFQIGAFSFFQTNSAGAEVLYNTVREYVGDVDDQVVFDLFSGTGTIGQLMAAKAQSVYGIELVEEAVEAAKVNAEKNGLANCHFVAGDVFVKVDELAERGIKPDVIVLDPPRMGVAPKALEKIIAFNAPNIVYVSCKASSLVENLKQLAEAGYEVTRAVSVDMFAHTPHVETVVKLSRNCNGCSDLK